MQRLSKLSLILGAAGVATALVLWLRPSGADLTLELQNRKSSPGGAFVLRATFRSVGTGAIRDGVRPSFRDEDGKDLGLGLGDVVSSAGLPAALGETCEFRTDRATLEAKGGMALEAQAIALRTAIDAGAGVILGRDLQRLEAYITAARSGRARPLLECGSTVSIDRTDADPEVVRVSTVLRVLPRTRSGEYELALPSLFYADVPAQGERRWWKVRIE